MFVVNNNTESHQTTRCPVVNDTMSVNQAAARTARAATAARKLGSLEQALALYERAISICEGDGDSGSLLHTELLEHVGSVCMDLNHFPKALDSFMQAHEFWARAQSARGTAKCDVKMGEALSRLGRPTEALIAYERALSVFESVGQAEEVARVLNNISDVHREQGNFTSGLNALARAQVLLAGTAKHGSTLATIQSNVGSIHFVMGNFSEALACDQRALAQRETEFGRDSVAVANSLVNMSTVQCRLELFEPAKAGLSRARTIYETHALRDSVGYANALLNLGVAHEGSAAFQDALECFEASLAIKRRLLPRDHPSLAGVLANIARVSCALGNDDDAVSAGALSRSVARRSQVQCAGTGCGRRLTPDGLPLEQCQGCKRTYYCSVECQRADWKATHRGECKSLQSALDGGGDWSPAVSRQQQQQANSPVNRQQQRPNSLVERLQQQQVVSSVETSNGSSSGGGSSSLHSVNGDDLVHPPATPMSPRMLPSNPLAVVDRAPMSVAAEVLDSRDSTASSNDSIGTRSEYSYDSLGSLSNHGSLGSRSEGACSVIYAPASPALTGVDVCAPASTA